MVEKIKSDQNPEENVLNEEGKEEIRIEPAIEVPEPVEEKPVEEPKIEIIEATAEKPKKEKKVKAKKEQKKEEHTAHHKSPEHHKTKETSMFKDVGIWRFAAILAGILLIASLFTAGFNFSGTSVKGALSEEAAAATVLDFVNNNLLQPGLIAQLQSTEDTGDLYKINLLVADQPFESYVTKDGRLLFPTGFEITNTPPLPLAPTEQNAAPVPIVEVVDNTQMEETVDVEVINTESDIPVIETAPPVVEVAEPTSVDVNLIAKRWRFDPETVTVNKGENIILSVTSEGIDAGFELPGFGLDFNLASGETSIAQFTADKTGTFSFSCTDCEGKEDILRGRLIVK